MRGATTKTHAQSSTHASSGGKPAGSGGTNAPHAQAPQRRPTNVLQPPQDKRQIQHTQPPQHVASPGHPAGVPSGGNPARVGQPPVGGAVSRPTGPESHPETAPTGKPAAPAPPAPVYHYNFPTKFGLIGRDFTRPLTPEEQSTIARQVEKGQPKGTQGAYGGDESENGAYHYNFRTKSGVIGRDSTRPLTADEQSTIARQLEKGQSEGTQGAHGGYDPENGAYHYNFRTKAGVVGRDFTRPLTPKEQSTIARQVENGPPARNSGAARRSFH